jgi:hypothetical protein
MEAIFFVAAMVGLVVGLGVWAARVLRRWVGWWRAAAVPPVAVLSGAAAVTIIGYRSEPAGDSFWWLWSFVLEVLAAVVAYLLHEVHVATIRRASIATAPPNVR